MTLVKHNNNGFKRTVGFLYSIKVWAAKKGKVKFRDSFILVLEVICVYFLLGFEYWRTKAEPK